MLNPSTEDTIYLVTVFRSANKASDRLERSWPIWTGANILLRPSSGTIDGNASCSGGYVPSDVFSRIRRISFYKSSHEQVTNQYIQLVEIADADEVLFRIKDLVLRLNERQCGHTSAYKIDRYIVATRLMNK
ncbi:hypothetical protein Ciccas_009711 [Cichlidogyrus casuarinus]|uniref:DUF7153 domain-containing protein n=1 Tax=Cichlidogyrus casuarinus TaxID=1844966 RepID=A0ABD2PWH6_9PLAT